MWFESTDSHGSLRALLARRACYELRSSTTGVLKIRAVFCERETHVHQDVLNAAGSATGEIYLWQFGRKGAVAGYTPLPASSQAPPASPTSLFSSSARSWNPTPGVPFSYWGQPQSVRHSYPISDTPFQCLDAHNSGPNCSVISMKCSETVCLTLHFAGDGSLQPCGASLSQAAL